MNEQRIEEMAQQLVNEFCECFLRCMRHAMKSDFAESQSVEDEMLVRARTMLRAAWERRESG